MENLEGDEKDFWDVLKYGPPLYELYSVNNFKEDGRTIEISGYVNIRNKREIKIEVYVDGHLIAEGKDYNFHPDALSVKDSYPTGVRIYIQYPVHFNCMIPLNMA